jgi:hypothetical protein
MRASSILCALAAATLPFTAAFAAGEKKAKPRDVSPKSIEEKNMAKGKFTFEPDMGYIYLHGATRQVGLFLKVPDQDDIDSYTKDWEEAFAKAQTKYAKKLKSWKAEADAAKRAKIKVPEKPEEPTRENFSIGAIELRYVASFGPEYVFSKDKVADKYAYMMRLRPGTYIYHGPAFYNAQTYGYMGTCYCMGSVQFEVKPGVVTDLGNFLSNAPNAASDVAVPTTQVIAPNTMWGATTINPRGNGGAVSFGLPASLQKFTAVQADFRASGKMDNLMGLMVSRIGPIPGVLAYQRDKVVDLKAPVAAAAAPIPPQSGTQ